MATTAKKGSVPSGITRQSSFSVQPLKAKKSQNLPVSSRGRKVEKTQPTVQTNESKKQKEYDENTEKQFESMLRGKLVDLPHLPRSMVRIFISSTFSDMRAERNTLSRTVFPRLKQFCLQKNLDFQVVDMRWGVTEDSQNDHSVEKICLMEVENCQKMSLGPNFVAIIGDRYGFRPIPTELGTDKFDLLKNMALTHELEDVKLLDIWYKLDENNLPPMYFLQPVRSQFTFFGDHSPGFDEPRKKDTEKWIQTHQDLQNLLRKAATLAFENKKLTADDLHQFYLSVTEMEMRKGLMDVDDPSSCALVFHRQLSGCTDLDDRMVRRHIDCVNINGNMKRDEDVANLQVNLRNQVKHKLKDSGVIDYNVGWQPGGIKPESFKDHEEYIQRFCQDFYNGLTNQIDGAISKQKNLIRSSEYYSDYQEVLHHLHFCKMKCETFCGREDVLDQIHKYIIDASKRAPLVLHAVSGAGKTSVMAMAMKNLDTWFKGKTHIGIIRFIGTSPQSSNIYDILRNVCSQLADCAQLIMEPVGYKSMKNIVDYIPRFFRRVSSTLRCPVVIFLDSLDQLSSAHNAYSMAWLPQSLPQNMKLIVSTLPKEYGILDNLKEIITEDKFYICLPILPPQTGRDIIDTYLVKKKRKVSLPQQQLVMKAFDKAPSPLFLKLMLDQAIKWTSFLPEHEHVLQDSVKGVINQLFNDLEDKFGKIVTSHLLGYITIAMNGISENELEDVLSCDDEALADLYRYHDPPVEGIVRCPPVIVARVLYDIKEYIVERMSYGKYTMNWYHRQFIETAKSRYTLGTDGEKLHRNLCEIFMAENGVQRTITLTMRKLTVPDADRQVTHQPYTGKNRRMLMCLPYHVTHARLQLPEKLAKENCFCNFKYLKAVLWAFSVETFVDILSEFLEKNDDEEIKKLRNFFSVAKTHAFNPSKLAVDIMAHILPDEDHEYLVSLIDQAEKYLIAEDKPALLPLFPCLAPHRDASSALLNTFEDVVAVLSDCPEAVLMRHEGEQNDEDIENVHSVYDFSSRYLSPVSIPIIKDPDLYPKLSKNGKLLVFTDQNEIHALNLVKKKSHVKSFLELEKSSKDQKVLSLNFSPDSQHLVVFFDNSLILLIDATGLQVLDQWSLNENPEDIAGIMCTSTENLQLIVASKTINGSTKKECGKWQFLKVGNKRDNIHLTNEIISKGLLGIAWSERIYVGATNSETGSVITAWDMSIKTVMSSMTLPQKVSQIKFSKSKPHAAVLLDIGIANLISLSEGVVLHIFETNNPVHEISVSWLFHLILLGDIYGQINLFDVRTGRQKGSFPAHANPVSLLHVQDDYVITCGKNEDMKIWSIEEIIEDIKEHERNSKISSNIAGLMAEIEISCFDIHPNGKNFVTISGSGILRLWEFGSTKFVKEMNLKMVVHKICITNAGIVIGLDQKCNKGIAIDIPSMSIINLELPQNILDFVLCPRHTSLYVISTKEKFNVVTQIDVALKKVKKSFKVKLNIDFISLSVCLSANERYLVIKSMLSKKEFDQVMASVKKQPGSFMPQPHPYRFLAVDLQQANGEILHCFRRLVKIPTLGEVVTAVSGNTMCITSRRWVVFWDIPTGKCDQRVCKNKEIGMMYRPSWVDNCTGTAKVMMCSPDASVLITGSEDGYLFMWDCASGYPIREQTPKTKHSASVKAAVISPNSSWVVSACKNNIVKLWDIATATEVFSTRVNAEVQDMKFSSDSVHVVIWTGTHITRLLIYKLLEGKL